MNKARPVNLDIGTIRLPITAYVSILHRITGVALLVGVPILLWLLDLSLDSAEEFARVGTLMDSFLLKLVVWGAVSALIYHTLAGVRHLIMDLGVGETLEGGQLGARIVLVLAVVLIVVAGALIW
ncbi:MAG: succinate dehydrogenase, cytochrome b556 subunit [Spongiibacteraceae bacterium]|nr:succinate dehydrogenase, cytochrome b556 subunit [Spongiibacteraceae bacterium]